MQTSWDLRNRVDALNAAGSLTDLLYDAVGNLKSTTDPNSHATSHSYDPLDRLTQTLDALSGTTAYGYDPQDQLTQVQAPNGATTTYQYDDLGNLLALASPDTGVTGYAQGTVAPGFHYSIVWQRVRSGSRWRAAARLIRGWPAVAADACAQGLCGPLPGFGISDLYTNAVDCRAERRDFATPFCAAVNSKPSTLRPARATPSPRAGRPGRSASTVCEAMQH